MSSPKTPDGFDLERDVPTTPEDIRVLRELRSRKPEADWLTQLQAAADAADLFPDAPRPPRRTFEGVEPFELDLT